VQGKIVDQQRTQPGVPVHRRQRFDVVGQELAQLEAAAAGPPQRRRAHCAS
jgi:hypothetical protein